MAKADGLCETADLDQIRFVEGHIEDPPWPPARVTR